MRYFKELTKSQRDLALFKMYGENGLDAMRREGLSSFLLNSSAHVFDPKTGECQTLSGNEVSHV